MPYGLALTLTAQDTSEAKIFEIGNSSYQMLSEAVGGWIECVRLKKGITMWVNDNGIAEGLDYNPTATAIYWTTYGFMSGQIFGNVIFTSSDDEGETIGLNAEQVDYLKMIAFDVVGIKPRVTTPA